MLQNGETIYDWIVTAIGSYSPVEVNGEYFMNWTYIAAAACLVVGVYFVFRGLLTFLKVVLGRE